MMENPTKIWMIWEYPYFRKPACGKMIWKQENDEEIWESDDHLENIG